MKISATSETASDAWPGSRLGGDSQAVPRCWRMQQRRRIIAAAVPGSPLAGPPASPLWPTEPVTL